MERKEILFIARNFPPNVGGMEILNFELYQNLKKKIPLAIYKNKGNIYSLIFLLKGLIKSFFSREKIIILSDGLLSIYVPMLKIINKIVIIRIHGLDITYSNPIYQIIIPKLVNHADLIICNSIVTKYECIKRHINKDKIRIIPPAIDINKYSLNGINRDIELEKILKTKTHNKKVILTVGRLVRRKGIAWFITNVLPELKHDFIFVIVGDGKEKKNIIKKINKVKLENKIFLLGTVSEMTKKILLNCADVFVIPNIKVKNDIEGFGIAAIEAASCGLPVVASNLEGIKDAIKNEENGFLVKPYDVKNYVKLIYKLITSNREGKEFGEKARKFTLENYTWDKITQKYLDVLDVFEK